MENKNKNKNKNEKKRDFWIGFFTTLIILGAVVAIFLLILNF